MANHQTSHRHTPEQPSPSITPTFKKPSSDPIMKKPSISRKISYRKPKPNTKTFAPPPVDFHLQAKAMAVSVDSDSKLFLHAKSKTKLEKEKSRNSKKEEEEEELAIDLNNLSVKDSNRRRSFCGSQIELADVLANCGVKVVSADMAPFMQIHAVDCARKTVDSLEKFTSKTLALTLKKEFDSVYGPAWHCIVGKSFGSFVTHSVGGFLYFSMDQKLHVLLFKTTVQRAD